MNAGINRFHTDGARILSDCNLGNVEWFTGWNHQFGQSIAKFGLNLNDGLLNTFIYVRVTLMAWGHIFNYIMGCNKHVIFAFEIIKFSVCGETYKKIGHDFVWLQLKKSK